MSQLKASHLAKVYRRRKVVKDVSLEINAAQTVGLLGPNGAGKTTSFYMMLGLVAPNGGKVFLDDKELTKLPVYERSKLGIGYLPQEPSIFRGLSIEDNLKAVLEFTSLSKTEREERVEQLLEEFNLTHLRGELGSTLSGGERRRTEIARTLATSPKFILLDEPFAGIDPISVAEIKEIIRWLNEKGVGVLITDHNVRDTLDICHKAYIINDGQVIATGDAATVLADPTAREIYLGSNFTM